MNTKQVIKNLMKERGLHALILTDGYNLHHLTGYRGHTGMLLAYGDVCMILTDSRYTEQVELEAPQVTCIDIGRDGYSKTIARYLADDFLRETNPDENTCGAGVFQSGTNSDENACGAGKLRIGFENRNISYMQYQAIADALKKACGDMEVQLVPLENSVDKLREVKDAEEIEKLAQAEAIGDRAFEKIVTFIREHAASGLTEQRIALQLEYEMRMLGAEGVSFDTIVASGKNGSLPHAMPSTRCLEQGDFVTMDFGCMYKGYCSDMTRTIHIGEEVDTEKKKVYNTVLKAQLAALSMIKPGVICKDVDKCARDMIAEAGYGDYFGHGLGHSVGLFIHEEPRFSTKCDAVLEPGVVITVEPGIYLPGRFGVRIEDMVVVTEDGYRNLASSPKDLLCI